MSKHESRDMIRKKYERYGNRIVRYLCTNFETGVGIGDGMYRTDCDCVCGGMAGTDKEILHMMMEKAD